MANLFIIKDLAEKKNMSIRELADRVGIKENQIHVMCRTNSTKIDTLERIAAELDAPISVFFDDTAAVAVSGNNNQVNGHGAHGNINGAVDSAVLAERVKSLEILIREKNERITELKERIEELKAR